MYPSSFFLMALVVLSQVVSSSPNYNNIQCHVVTQAISTIHATSQATKFCSSYLGITTSTATVTTSPSAPCGPTKTKTVSATATLTSTVTRTTAPVTTVTQTSTILSTSSITCATSATTIPISSTAAAASTIQKRMYPTTTKHNSPEPTPSCFQGWKPHALSSACSCLSIKPSTTTSTTTVGGGGSYPGYPGYPIPSPTTTKCVITTTTTVATTTATTSTIVTAAPTTVTEVTSTTAISTAIVPTGLRYHRYVVPVEGGPGVAEQWRNNTGFVETGVVDDINTVGADPSTNEAYTCRSPPLSTAGNCSTVAVVMQGFLYAPTAGRYTLSSPAVDNSAWIFTGTTAYGAGPEWTEANANYLAIFPDRTGSFAYDLVAGQALPIAVVWINTWGPGNMFMNITGPGGTVSQSTAGQFLPPCDQSQFVP